MTPVTSRSEVGSSSPSIQISLPATPPLLETKLYIPRMRPGLVSRSGLIDRLRVGAEGKLTLITAPPGFGKTTLVAEWLAERADRALPACWISLDPSENDPGLFWAYVIHALKRVHPGIGSQALSLLGSPHPRRQESMLADLINEIDALESDVLLILDDYHVIESSAVHAGVSVLLDRLPPRMHLVIASRSDPPLPIARLRARGELTELRIDDLRFTFDQTSAFLGGVMELSLSTADTARLERRTEGWIAGLKLAALSMKGRENLGAFVEAFSGNDRYIADYLVEEVLQAQAEDVRAFLLHTSILDRLSAPLCDAVAGIEGSQALLDSLERRNLFVVALDDRREWYRYHHLFAEVLQARGLRDDPGRMRAAHRRASDWYESQGSPADAVRHALAGGDLDRTADLLEMTWPEKDRSYRTSRWLDQVKSLPDALVRARPVLTMAYAWALLNRGELEAAEPRLREVERWLEDATGESEQSDRKSSGRVVADVERLRSLPMELFSARAYLAQTRGDIRGTIEYTKRSLELIPSEDHLSRAIGTALLALARWASGELEAAYETFSEALACMRTGGAMLSAVRGTFVLGDLRVEQGRLREAVRIYEQGLRLADEQGGSGVAETDELYLGMSEVRHEWGDVEGAVALLDAVTQAAGRAQHAGNRQRWCTAMARVRLGRGDPDGALELLAEAEAAEIATPLPRVRPIAAIRARVWIRQGRLDEANRWAEGHALSVDDDLVYLREFEHLTLAKLLIARHRAEGGGRSIHEAMRLLDRLSTEAERNGRGGAVIETLILLATSDQALGNPRGALAYLDRALVLAEPEGYLQIFMDEGLPMRDLLRQALARGIGGASTRRVLAGFDEPPKPGPTADATSPAGLVQPLTARELVILRLIASGLRNQEIAEHLFISPATVKRHIANAYAKLGVGHRTEALVRASALKLL